ncbi:MAG: 2,3-bisphosphoglycerate-independent phosphoglycerate mutase, partial [Deltaproteobacteria bacterium]|nr:2,3-bisphosphoglycerate-independent phosphoglycerate mutase [Deltaproteobacteria bacterium]
PGSDVGHLSVLGYDPHKYYTGRAPIEAVAMKIPLGKNDIAFRCNLVRLDEKNGQTLMGDFTAGHISNEKAHPLIRLLNEKLACRGAVAAPGREDPAPTIKFYPGVSYRHLMVWKNGKAKTVLTPPHDLTDKPIAPGLPQGEAADFILGLMQESQKILVGNGTEANSIWLWGQGRSTTLTPFPKKGGLISAVDIVRGVGLLAGLEIVSVPGATGYFDTDYEAKAAYALKALEKDDFVFVHVEATDEAGHMGNKDQKASSVSDIDQRLIGTLLKGLVKFKEYRILVTSDHATPCHLKTHTPDPAVYLIYDSTGSKKGRGRFTEKDAAQTGNRIRVGHEMMKKFLQL